MQGPASPFRVPRPQKSLAMLPVRAWQGEADSLGLRRRSDNSDLERRLTPPESREAGNPCLLARFPVLDFSEASSLIQVPGRTRQTGYRPNLLRLIADSPG